MDDLLIQVLSESGIISMLFVAMFFFFLLKGLPYIAKKFEEMQERHQIAFDQQRKTFEETMQKIVDTFNSQIEKSNNWHEKHSSKLDKNIIHQEELKNSIIEIKNHIKEINIKYPTKK